MRIVAGSLRGRRLVAPEGMEVRPTGARAREAVFNILEHGHLGPGGGSALVDARVLDGFAGTGAMGLEALSRGAASAAFLDSDRRALAALRANIAACGVGARALVMPADIRVPPQAPMACDLVFLDPPYHEGLAESALAALAKAGWFAPEALICLELGPEDTVPETAALAVLDERRYGKARVVFLRNGAG
ncbi:MAG: 16S rRNA (guanine(966)-N(2))-methyltransferase RsmD [Alphaproteobacteria bacterium]